MHLRAAFALVALLAACADPLTITTSGGATDPDPTDLPPAQPPSAPTEEPNDPPPASSQPLPLPFPPVPPEPVDEEEEDTTDPGEPFVCPPPPPPEIGQCTDTCQCERPGPCWTLICEPPPSTPTLPAYTCGFRCDQWFGYVCPCIDQGYGDDGIFLVAPPPDAAIGWPEGHPPPAPAPGPMSPPPSQ